jgi:hypothetical protein
MRVRFNLKAALSFRPTAGRHKGEILYLKDFSVEDFFEMTFFKL